MGLEQFRHEVLGSGNILRFEEIRIFSLQHLPFA